MKFTLSWLRDHLDTTASLVALTDALTDLGLEVEAVTDPGAALSTFRLAKILAASPHPDADRLQVCRVETDQGETQIVCGASNARAGITVVLARPGDYVPGIDTTLSIGKIRGVESHGMMASERELCLSDAHEGIIELPSGQVGQQFVDWLAENAPEKIDPTIHIKITPNRPDALGVRGVARDLASRGLGVLKDLPPVGISADASSSISVSIDPEIAGKVPFFSGRVIRGVRNGTSPDWLQQRLRAIGLRPINTLVDITNFMTFDLNRPMHVFDADRLSGSLSLRGARRDETLAALDEKTYALPEGAVVICDDTGPQSIAGVMGGLATGCDADTQNVFVESAFFEPISVAATGRTLKINSDARYRFERGIDPSFTLEGLDRATQMIISLCGGSACQVVTAGRIPTVTRSYDLDPQRTEQLVGLAVTEDQQRTTLEALGFQLDGWTVQVPTWRPDILGEADLVEEIARVAGLSGLNSRPLPRLQTGVPRPILTPLQTREKGARRQAAALGYHECMTYSFIDEKLATLFGGGGDALRIENPISSEMSHLRPNLLPGLLSAVARNQARGAVDMALFEIGPVFFGSEPGEQSLQLAAVLVGCTSPRDPHGSRRSVDLYDAKADAEAVLAAIGSPAKAQITRKLANWWHPGRAGNIALGPNILASFGEIHPSVLRHMDIKGPVVAFNIRVALVPFPKSPSVARQALDSSELQSVTRDFAFVVAPHVEASALVNAAAGADKGLIQQISVFDQFEGLEDGKKSVAITVRLQPRSHTLTDSDIEAVSRKITEKVRLATGGVLRT